MSNDKEASVRLEAAFALGYRKSSREAFRAEKEAFLSDADERVRGALVSNLANMRAEFPEVRRLIEDASESDQSDYVRKLAPGAS